MRHFVLATLCLGLLACGGQDAATPLGEAGDEIADVASGAAEEAGDAAGAAIDKLDPSAASCLDLVAKTKWSEAVDTCTEAVNIAPENTELRNALAAAKQGAETEAAGAIKSASDDAGELLGQ